MRRIAASAWILLCAGIFCPAQTVNKVQNWSYEISGPTSTGIANWEDWANGGGVQVCNLSAPNIWNGSCVARFSFSAPPPDLSGMRQTIAYNQTTAKPIQFFAFLQGKNIQNDSSDKNGATLNCHVYYMDRTMDYCPTTLQTKNVGTFPFRQIGFNTANTDDFPNDRNADGSLKPVQSVEIIPMMGQIAGIANFDSTQAYEYVNAFKGGITIMFDDGFSEQKQYCQTLIQNGVPCTWAIVVSYLGTPGYVSLANVKTEQSNGAEIVDHSWSHLPMAGDSTHAPMNVNQLQHEFYDSKVWFVQNGITVNHFMLPYGSYNAQVIGEGGLDCWYNHNKCFNSIRSTDRGSNPIGQFPWNIHIQEVDTHKDDGTLLTMGDVDNWIAEAKQNKRWLVILFHKVRSNCAGDNYCTSPSMFTSVMNAAKQSGLSLYTYSQGFNASEAMK
ncbi:MAG TPA: polysaccharide deacetylase family protein [Candidatus Paceibacterota bacterium]|jgi:peptidoglycan/xylan/chitin deacetylase (PgdA/CDA1 family)|nr:polysaccharide deacetylase family protein [Candidatus Paceibacterota bacterium]